MTDTFYSATRVGDTWTNTGMSSGDTIPNCLGEFREIRESKERTGIAAYGHPAGTPGATSRWGQTPEPRPLSPCGLTPEPIDAPDLVRGHIAHCLTPFPPSGRFNALPDQAPEA